MVFYDTAEEVEKPIEEPAWTVVHRCGGEDREVAFIGALGVCSECGQSCSTLVAGD